KGWNINDKDKEGNSLLYNSVSALAIDEIKFLIANGADVNNHNKLGQTPLHITRSPLIARLLINAGADINAIDNNGKTPAFCVSSPLMLDFYKSHGADIPQKDRNNATPLHYACFRSNYDMVNYYIKNGFSINVIDKHGSSPLHHNVKYGVCGGSAMITCLLLINNANPNIRDYDGRTPLHYAIIKPVAYKAVLLLKFGANPNIKDKLGNTPLHYAAALPKNYFIDPRILLNAGADPNIKNNKGETPADIARKSKSNRKGAFLRRLQMGVDNQAEKAKKNGR
ncbi:MAG: ankyrin repeat domain-containing protein, partial [Firmicutes bacterium]|nr:ankyrin repeat domain-containing protein [Bacillota bacterium]